MLAPTVAFVGVALASAALAHGFGERYDLPVPLHLYLIGAGAAIALSFIGISLFQRGPTAPGYPRVELLGTPIGQALARPAVVRAIRAASLLVFLLVIVSGLFGSRDPNENLAPTVVWVLWWVGVAYVSALIGNVWELLNPWTAGFDAIAAWVRRGDPDATIGLGAPYPAWLGQWPGVVLFFGFAWLELVLPTASVPADLATAILVYTGITWAGMLVFGRDVWLRHGEAFTLAFGLLARFAPSEVRVEDAAPRRGARARSGMDADDVNDYAAYARAPSEARRFSLRPFAAGLLRPRPVSISMTAFTIVLLSTVTFDGFTATPAWAAAYRSLYPAIPSSMALGTLGMVWFIVTFAGLYLVTCVLMQVTAGVRGRLVATARAFVTSLIPIALAYHLAHYLSYLLVQGQRIVALVSDPFGFGWNLFGTADAALDVGVVGPRFAWYTAVVAIVIGHVIAVYVAHVIAMRTHRSRSAAVRSQIPMTLLMIGYTVISLWILAQPIVEVSAPA